MDVYMYSDSHSSRLQSCVRQRLFAHQTAIIGYFPRSAGGVLRTCLRLPASLFAAAIALDGTKAKDYRVDSGESFLGTI